MKRKPETSGHIDWDATTWEGSRRRQIERWSTLSLTEILKAQEAMAELSRKFAPPSENRRRVGKPRSKKR